MIESILLSTFILTLLSAPYAMIKSRDKKYALKWTGIGFIFNLVFMSGYVYFFLPPLTGPLGGFYFLWFPLLINLVIAGVSGFIRLDADSDLTNRYSPEPERLSITKRQSNTHKYAAYSMAGSLGVFLVLVLLIAASSWIGRDREKLAFTNVTQAQASTIQNVSIPGADEKHLPIVSDDIAANRAASSFTNTMGSNYAWGKQVLQNIDGHLYRVSLMNFKDFWAWWRSPSKTTPGYIKVDAENPLVESEKPTDYTVRYFTGNYFNNDLLRHLYLNGYTHYLLVDPTVEVSDDLKVYETVGLGKYVFGWSGIDVQKMAIVDVSTGDIQVCDVDKCPAWIDRILPSDVTATYVNWWGNYISAGWFNPGHVNTLETATDRPVALYDKDGYCAWQDLMTSSSSTDNAGVGVMFYDARAKQGTYYPFDNPFPIGSQVVSLFENNKNLRQANNKVDQLIFVNIFNQPTWMATMVTTGSVGLVYQNTAFVRASKNAASEDVQFDKDPKIAVRNYQLWLASHQNQAEMDVTQQNQKVSLTGTVTSIGTTDANGNTYHIFTLADASGQPVTYKDPSGAVKVRYFVGLYDPTTRIELPLAKIGDHVALTYQDTNLDQAVQIETFDDLDVPPQ